MVRVLHENDFVLGGKSSVTVMVCGTHGAEARKDGHLFLGIQPSLYNHFLIEIKNLNIDGMVAGIAHDGPFSGPRFT